MSQLCAGMKSQLILGGAITVVIVPVVIYATVVIVQSEGPKEGYCNIKSCRGKPHTMCEYVSFSDFQNNFESKMCHSSHFNIYK